MCTFFVLIPVVVLGTFVLHGSSEVQDYEGFCGEELSQGLSTFKECLLKDGFKKKCEFQTLPEIKEITVSSGGNVTLSCLENTDYYHWYYPWRAWTNNAYRLREDYIVKATQYYSELLWEEETLLTNVSYVLTGLYTCHSRFYNPCRYIEQSYYLYIKDENVLSLYNTRMFSNDYDVYQYEELEIQCIPTSPDVKVDLFIGTSADKELQQKVVLDTIDENDVIYSYSPQQGFKTNDTLVAGVKIYTCRFSRNFKEEYVTSRIIIKPLNPTIYEPAVVRNKAFDKNNIGERLVLDCIIETEKNFTIEWLTPQADSDPRVQVVSESKSLDVSNEITSSFSLEELNTSDSGVYYCIARYEEMDFSVGQKIILLQEYFISFSNSYYVITDLASSATGITVVLKAVYEAYPSQLELYWLKDGEEIALLPPSKVSTWVAGKTAILKINYVDETDLGMYTLVARSSKIKRKIRIPFYNFGVHDAVIKVDDDDLGLVHCIAFAYPKPTISWYYRSNSDNDIRSFQLQPVGETYSEQNGLQVTSRIKIYPAFSGELLCSASNSIVEDVVSQKVEDLEIDFEIHGPNIAYFKDGKMRVDVNTGDSLRLTCVVSLHKYNRHVFWYTEGTHFNNYELEYFDTIYSKQAIITFHDVYKEGDYTCEVSERLNSDIKQYRRIQVVVGDKKISPNITDTNLDDDIKVPLYEEFKLYCNVAGFPSPNVSWIKDNIVLEPSDKFNIKNYNQSLLITNYTKNEFGVYRCEAVNSEGTVYKEIHLKPSSSFIIDYWYIELLIVILMLVLIVLLIFAIIKMRNQKKVMKSIGLINFEEGALDSLNPELQLNEQADSLPYNAKWEIPVKNIELGKKLGSGAFGIVMKGELKSKSSDGLYHTIPVAIKTFKKGSNLSCLKALASELKIMANLGSHLNIVNLLGACTKNITKRELLVIVEYCQFGNLHQFLQNHRKNYISQVDSAGQVDYSIGQDVDRSAAFKKESGQRSKYLESVRCAEFPFEGTPEPSSAKLDEVPTIEDVQLNCHQKYSHDNVTYIYTRDLIAWGFQVARGMEYLSSRKVLHGDLAARNILLADNNIVKICDFGLSKNMYYNDIYRRTTQVLLPIKWMALESMTSRIFSTQSDVWSFGVVLWEFFSLAGTPYPTMEVDAVFVKKISEGYRMESPKFAPKELYSAMLDCWQADPSQRPSFTKLADKIGAMLEEPVKDLFLIEMDNNQLLKN